MRRGCAGYTILEAALVVSLVTVASGAALVQMRTTITEIDADTASATVMNHLKYAREIAIDQRFKVLVEFVAPSTIKITEFIPGGTSIVVATTTLPAGITFGLPTGIPDTPEAYGNSAAVSFNGAMSGTFLPDGVFVNADGIVVSGSVFTIGSNGNASARAITLSGPNGRIRQYYIKNNAWSEKRTLGA